MHPELFVRDQARSPSCRKANCRFLQMVSLSLCILSDLNPVSHLHKRKITFPENLWFTFLQTKVAIVICWGCECSSDTKCDYFQKFADLF